MYPAKLSTRSRGLLHLISLLPLLLGRHAYPPEARGFLKIAFKKLEMMFLLKQYIRYLYAYIGVVFCH